MATTTTTTTTTTQLKPTPKCRRTFLETTITTTPSASATSSQPPPIATSSSPSPLNLKMDPYNNNNNSYYPTSLNKFNNALTAGLLNPHSPPPPPTSSTTTRSSPTLFEMMSNEPESQPVKSTQTHHINYQNYPHNPTQQNYPNGQIGQNGQNGQKGGLNVDKQALLQQRLVDIIGLRSPGNQFNDVESSDVKLKLSSKDGLTVVMNVHRQILVGHSRFFCEKLGDLGLLKQRPYDIEIADCDDVEVYIETLRLMYCRDLRRWLMREDVPKVLGILKVSAAIGFDAGVLSCLEYLEAAPWAEDEEEKVASLLSELQLERFGAGEVLKRVSFDVVSGHETHNDNEEVLLKLLHVVLEGKDEKARREMKQLVCKMLRESSSKNDLRKESLYLACDECLELLRDSFLQVAEANFQNVSQIARQADNLRWILDIMIDRQIADDFLATWSSQSQLSEAHSKVPPLHRYEISNVTARLFVGIGKGQLLASKDDRCMLMKTWLVPFYDDFGWMRRASRGLDRHLIEEGLTNAILTLPIPFQQEIFMSWFNRFLNSGDDCPNIQRGFETWWKRAFWRRNNEPDRPRQLRIMNGTVQNS